MTTSNQNTEIETKNNELWQKKTEGGRSQGNLENIALGSWIEFPNQLEDIDQTKATNWNKLIRVE